MMSSAFPMGFIVSTLTVGHTHMQLWKHRTQTLVNLMVQLSLICSCFNPCHPSRRPHRRQFIGTVPVVVRPPKNHQKQTSKHVSISHVKSLACIFVHPGTLSGTIVAVGAAGAGLYLPPGQCYFYMVSL